MLESADFFSATAVTRTHPSPSNLAGYEGIIFEYIKPLKVPQDDAKIDSWTWQYGWRLWNEKTDHYYWLCRDCHKRRKLIKMKEPL